MRKLEETAAIACVVCTLAAAAILTFVAVAADSSLYGDGAQEPFFAPEAPVASTGFDRGNIDAYIEAHAFMMNALGARPSEEASR